MTTEERFWSKVKIGSPDECWPWSAAMSNGYGIFSIKHKLLRRAHRVAWEMANGQPVPSGLFVCHTCDNGPCCNPAHLWIGTNKDNMQDAKRKGRTRGGRPRKNQS